MPKYTMPDGNVYDFSSDEEATDAMSAWNKQFGAEQPAKAPQSRSLLNQYLINPINEIAGAVVEPALSMGTSMVAKPVSELAGMGAIGTHALGLTQADPREVQQATSEAMTYQPRTQLGSSQYNPLNAIPTAIGGAVGGLTDYALGSMEESPLKSGTKEAIEQGVGFLGVKGVPKAKSMAEASNAAKLAKLQEVKALESLTNDIRKKGQELGLVAPAIERAGRAASSWGGVNPHISYKNMKKATSIISEELGIEKGAITDTKVATRLSELSKDYSIVEKALPKKVAINDPFKVKVAELLAPMKERFAQDPQAFSGYKGAIDLLEQQLRQNEISPSVLIEKVKTLRSDARIYDKNPSGTPLQAELAKSSYELANIYEDLIETTLGDKKAILDKFKDSRKKMAQIHMIDSSRMADGLIDLRKLSSNVGKYGANKKFVTGNIKTIADFANAFDKVTEPITKEKLSSMGKWEAAMGVGGVLSAPATGGGSLIAATPAASRMIFPWMAEKGYLQGKVPSYDLSGTRKALPYAAQGMMGATALTPYIEEE